MAELLDVNPTRGNLLRLKEELKGTRTRHQLLDRKRKVLVQELMQRVDEAEELERRSQELFAEAHGALQEARMRLGSDRLDWICLSPTAQLEINLSTRTLMGLRIPSTGIEVRKILPPYGLSDTCSALDEAREKWLEVVRFLADASETMTGVWRITMELRKTRRQVNALESVRIPLYERTIRHIEEHLEEEEREEIVKARKVKEMHQKS